jgi:hypothetical protein
LRKSEYRARALRAGENRGQASATADFAPLNQAETEANGLRRFTPRRRAVPIFPLAQITGGAFSVAEAMENMSGPLGWLYPDDEYFDRR